MEHRSALEKFTRRVDFIRSGRLCIMLTRLTEITGLVQFIRSGLLCIISTRLAKNARTWGHNTRSGGRCIMFTGLTNITELYNVWASFYNINRACQNSRPWGRIICCWWPLHIVHGPQNITAL